MPKGGDATYCNCEYCGEQFKKKYQGNTSNRYCNRDCHQAHIITEKIKSGEYTRNSAMTYFKRFTDYKCSCCGISEWNGKEIRLQIDHIDGNNKNDIVENFRYLCPNCHTQTETWGVRNVSKEGAERLKLAAKIGNAIKNGKLPKGTTLNNYQT